MASALQRAARIRKLRYVLYGGRLRAIVPLNEGHPQIWEQDATGEWVWQTEWKVGGTYSRSCLLLAVQSGELCAQAHLGPVWKLDWSHPEFGQVHQW